MMFLLDLVTTVSIGLMIGSEFAVSVFINPALRKLDQPAQLSAIRIFAGRLGKAMPFWYVLSLVLLIVEAVLRRSDGGFALLAGSAAIWVSVIVLTLLFLVPINNRLARMSPAARLDEALQEHKRWDSLHRVRVAALGAAMICFLLAIRA